MLVKCFDEALKDVSDLVSRLFGRVDDRVAVLGVSHVDQPEFRILAKSKAFGVITSGIRYPT